MPCNCIKIEGVWKRSRKRFSILSYPSSVLDGYNYYTFRVPSSVTGGQSVLFLLFYDITSNRWVITLSLSPDLIAFFSTESDCPIGTWTLSSFGKRVYFDELNVSACDQPVCEPVQDRTKLEVSSIKLPKVTQDEDRGYFKCCCPFMVFASQSNDSWKNDISSAWIKLSSNTDTATCELWKNGVLTTYQPTAKQFVKENNAFYWTVKWKDVLSSDGIGCYSIKISYNISGVSQTFTWGVYNLRPYSIQNALKTARLRVILDSFQEIEGIDFTDSKVEDSIRFYGFIGMRQPNMETDNLIYKNREVKKVVRENLNTYEIHVDPTCNEHIDKLTDLYLLSENELYLSDYNAHNPSYNYKDVPAIVEESPEIQYFDFSREVGLTCKVGDKFKNKRSYYK